MRDHPNASSHRFPSIPAESPSVLDGSDGEVERQGPLPHSARLSGSLDQANAFRHHSRMEKPQLVLFQTKWKLPPREKVHEALSAVLDDRVTLRGEGIADVSSSDRSKKYTVTWTEDKKTFGANDNASFYQGYIGYPIIAVLLALEILPFEPERCSALKDVPWKALNKQFKNKYDQAVDALLTERLSGDSHRDAINAYVDSLYSKLEALELGRQRPPGRPPG